MATLDLTAVTTAPWVYTVSGVATTWQEVTFPAWAKVRVNADAAFYVGYASNGNPASVETPSDGGAVGTHRMPVAAGTSIIDFPERSGSVQQPGPQPKRAFFAAQSGTVNLSFELVSQTQAT